MIYLRSILLAPLSWLYGLALLIRHYLYDRHLLPSFSVNIPTVCVGNIAAGGTGKTPHVEYLIRLLSARYKVAVLSRGYKRRTHGFLLATSDATALTIGDEPMQIFSKFPNIPVAVCENRVHGIHQLQKHFPDLQVVILDDAMQHRTLRCGYYLLLTAYDNLFVDDHLLPWGNLRDLKDRSLVAHSVIVTKCPANMYPIDKRIVDSRLHLPTYQKLFFSHIQYPALPCTGRPLVVTGIARSKDLFDYVQQLEPRAELLDFPDHHVFTDRDIATIADCAKAFSYVLTTEKDYTRFATMNLPDELSRKLHVMPIAISMGIEQPQFDQQILTYVAETLRRQKNKS